MNPFRIGVSGGASSEGTCYSDLCVISANLKRLELGVGHRSFNDRVSARVRVTVRARARVMAEVMAKFGEE